MCCIFEYACQGVADNRSLSTGDVRREYLPANFVDRYNPTTFHRLRGTEAGVYRAIVDVGYVTGELPSYTQSHSRAEAVNTNFL